LSRQPQRQSDVSNMIMRKRGVDVDGLISVEESTFTALLHMVLASLVEGTFCTFWVGFEAEVGAELCKFVEIFVCIFFHFFGFFGEEFDGVVGVVVFDPS